MKYLHPAKSIFSNKRGQTLIEYGLLLVLIAVVVVGALTFVGQSSNNTWSKISNAMP